ncbi:phosphoribosylanthranilate isomerase, partial [Bacteroides fragilis]|nr:phosphoribosylanthranilate isomerase [Bacteroides fragilis]
MMNDKLIKVCGMCEAKNIREVEQLKVDMIGSIFYPTSPLCLSELPAHML